MAYVPTHWVAHPDSLAKTQEAAAAINKLEQAVADLSDSDTSGSGILNVSGTVNLDDEPGIREVYATAAATVEGVELEAGDAAVFRYHSGAWTFMVVGQHTSWQPASGYVPPPDTIAPTGGTLAVTGTGDAGSTRTLTVSGATDSGSGLHAQPYSFSTDGGTTWSSWQASTTWTSGALAAGTYQPRARVRDAASTPNVATLTAASFTVASGPTYSQEVLADSPLAYWPLDDATGTTTPLNLGSGSDVLTLGGTIVMGQSGTGIGDGATAAVLDGSTQPASVQSMLGGAATFAVSALVHIATDRPYTNPGPFVYTTPNNWTGTLGAIASSASSFRPGAQAYIDGSPRLSSGAMLQPGRGVTYLWTAHYDGSTLRVLVNGVESGTPVTGLTGAVYNQAGTSYFGSDFKGRIAGLAIWRNNPPPLARFLAHATAAGV